MGPNKTKLTCFNTVLECKSFTRIILITVKDEPQCCSIACYSFSKILWGSFTAMSWCLTIIGVVVLSARSRSKSCKKKMNLLRHHSAPLCIHVTSVDKLLYVYRVSSDTTHNDQKFQREQKKSSPIL